MADPQPSAHVKDITGRKFGRLTVLKYAGIHPSSRAALWLCICACSDKLVTVAGVNLRSGLTKSCGCLQKDRSRAHNRYHGNGLFGRSRQLWEEDP